MESSEGNCTSAQVRSAVGSCVLTSEARSSPILAAEKKANVQADQTVCLERSDQEVEPILWPRRASRGRETIRLVDGQAGAAKAA